MKPQLKIKRIHEDAKIPTRGSEEAVGRDIYAIDDGKPIITAEGGKHIVYPLGLKCMIPKGYGMFIFPRSSISTKTTLMLGNSVGVVESDYRGELMAIYRDTAPSFGHKYKKGDRIGQIVLLEVPEFDIVEVDEVDETERGEGGFGSSGK